MLCNCTKLANTALRLKKVEGQIRGIIKMLETEKPCVDVLIQISAAKSALHKAGQKLLERYIEHSIADGQKEGDFQNVIKNLNKAIEQFARIS